MTKKKPTYKELEKDLDIVKIISIGFFIITLILVVGFISGINNQIEMERELQSCQEQVDVWTLEWVCKNENVSATFVVNYSDYNIYNEVKENIQTDGFYEYCEVLK